MNKKLKDGLIAGFVLLGIGGIAAGITIPLVTQEVKNVSLDWDGNSELITGITGNDFINEVGDLGERDRTSLSTFNYQVAFYLYEKEQLGSLQNQIDFFEWEIYQKRAQIQEEKNSEDGRPDQNKIKNWNEEIKKIDEKITKVEAEIKGLDTDGSVGKGIDYNSSSLGSDYSRILLPLSKVREKRTKIFMDTKENFIKKFATRQEGLNQWPDERRNLYNNAATDSEAIDYLAHQQISGEAFSQFKFKLNGDYSLEQKLAKKQVKNKVTGEVIEGQYEYIFDFLKVYPVVKNYDQSRFNTENALDMEGVKENKAIEFEGEYYFGKENWKEIKNDKVWFLSTTSKIESQLEISPELYNEILTTDMIEVNHALIAGIQNEEKVSSPWTIDKEVVRKLITMYGKGNNASSAYKLVSNLFPKVDKNDTDTQVKAKEKDTRLFIDTFSGDPSGKDKYGSLGVMTVSDYVSKMVPGFGFGVLSALEIMDTSKSIQGQDWTQPHISTAGKEKGRPVYFEGSEPADQTAINSTTVGSRQTTNFMEALQWNIEIAMKELGLDGFTTQAKLMEKFDDLTEDEIKKEFGKAFRNTFDGQEWVDLDNDGKFDKATEGKTVSMGSDGVRMIYGASGTDNDAYAVLSSHGVHVIKVASFNDEAKIRGTVNEDLQKVADEQNASLAKNNYSDLFQNHFDEVTKIQFIIENYNKKEDGSEAVVDGDGVLYKYMYEQLVTKNNTIKDVDFQNWWTNITRIIEADQSTKANEKIDAALGDKVTSFYIGGMDKGTIALDTNMKPEEIYNSLVRGSKRERK